MMRRSNAIILLVVFAIGLALGAWRIHDRAEPKRQKADVAGSLSANEDAGFARATTRRSFSFPADHGPHPAFKQEWWYYTGNLTARDGRHFGFQLTFFRIALASKPIALASDWATNTIYMAHFAVTDVAHHRFYASQRLERAALALAGAQARPLRVWLDDWRSDAIGAENPLRVRLHAATDEAMIDLQATALSAPILQGDRGLSRKSAESGSASYYYSIPRLTTRGTIRIGTEHYEVSGLTWMDREWSTSALASNQIGWDWFALQLSDGSDLMWYQLRRRDGTIDPYSSGALIRDARTHTLAPTDVRLHVIDHWHSPHSAARYPSAWQLDVPRLDLHLDITPYVDDQELHNIVTYWEGAVRVRGARGSTPLHGSGYAELTGYASRP